MPALASSSPGSFSVVPFLCCVAVILCQWDEASAMNKLWVFVCGDCENAEALSSFARSVMAFTLLFYSTIKYIEWMQWKVRHKSNGRIAVWSRSQLYACTIHKTLLLHNILCAHLRTAFWLICWRWTFWMRSFRSHLFPLRQRRKAHGESLQMQSIPNILFHIIFLRYVLYRKRQFPFFRKRHKTSLLPFIDLLWFPWLQRQRECALQWMVFAHKHTLAMVVAYQR